MTTPRTPPVQTDLERLLSARIKSNAHDHSAIAGLLELHYEAGRDREFLQLARELAKAGWQRRPDWGRICAMSRMLGIRDPLFKIDDDAPLEFVASFGGGDPKQRRLGDRDGDVGEAYFPPLQEAWAGLCADPEFIAGFDKRIAQQAFRVSPLFGLPRLSRKLGGASIFLKRCDLAPAGWRLATALFGQAYAARELRREELAFGCDQAFEGVLAATVAARLGLKLTVFLPRAEYERNADDVFHMRIMGAKVSAFTAKRGEPDDPRLAALAHCAEAAQSRFLMVGLDFAPAPYPSMVREFSSVTGRECRQQFARMLPEAPHVVAARAGNNADAIGLFEPFLASPSVRLVRVETASSLGTAAAPAKASDKVGRVIGRDQEALADRIMEGVEYPGITRELAFLDASGRVETVAGKAEHAREAITDCARLDGLLLPIRTAFVVAWACTEAARRPRDEAIVVMLTERPGRDEAAIRAELAGAERDGG